MPDDEQIRCDTCDETEDLTTGPDPYIEEICGRIEIVTLCKKCYHEACMDIQECYESF